MANNIYRSNHTGAQVDDAVKKVLAVAPADGDELQKKLKEGTNITIATDGTISATNPTPSVTIAATAADDDVVVLTGSGDVNSVSYDAKHAKKGPSSGYTSGNTTTSISGSGGTIKIPQITVDNYGHVTAAADEDVTITMPDAGANYSVIELTNNQTTLTQEQYNTLIASPFNKIKYSDHLYILYSETTTSDYLVYTTNYLNYGNCIRISKSTKAITKENVTSLTVNNYSVMNYIGAKDKSSNAATENGNTYLKLYTNGTKKSQFNIKGEGATTITSDVSGNITITSTDTNTDTKVTSVDNHYPPTANSVSAIEKDASSTTEATWGTTSLVTGVNIQRDAKGHVTGMTLDSIKMPAKPDTSGLEARLTALEARVAALEAGSSELYTISGSTDGKYYNLTAYDDFRDYFYGGQLSSLTLSNSTGVNFDINCGNGGSGVVITYGSQQSGGTGSGHTTNYLNLGTSPIKVTAINIEFTDNYISNAEHYGINLNTRKAEIRADVLIKMPKMFSKTSS